MTNHLRPFSEWLTDHAQGVADDEATAALAEVVEAVAHHGKAGTVTIKRELEPAGSSSRTVVLRRTPEWQAWLDGQGLGPQVRFAERIEDGLPEIADPAAATMLEIAQTFHAATSATFQSGNRLTDGRTQFAYLEDVKASAGSKPGTVEIPETFTIVVRPFIGAEPYKVTARLRYRLKGGELTIGYTLVRPNEVELDAFRAVASVVQDGLPTSTHLAGRA